VEERDLRVDLGADELEGGENRVDGGCWEADVVILVDGCSRVGRVEDGGEGALSEITAGSGVELEDELVVVKL
jgi:hypothetical protein